MSGSVTDTRPQKHKQEKEKVEELDLNYKIRPWGLQTAVKKASKQPIEWERVPTNHCLIKKLHQGIYEGCLSSSTSFSSGQSVRIDASLQRHVDGQRAHKTMLSISDRQGNAGQSHSETSLHTHQEGPEGEQMANAGEGGAVGAVGTVLVGMQSGTAPLENVCWHLHKKIKKSYYMTQRFCFLVWCISKRKETYVHIKTCI